jgi:acyl-CoA synthetase (AMP-forming)/AMP-acid ligase II
VAHIAGIIEQATPAIVIVPAGREALFARAVATAGLPRAAVLTDAAWADVSSARAPFGMSGDHRLRPREAPGDLALLQFTSGSTGRPRGVRVTWGGLAANLAVIKRWAGWEDGDGVASWLPLHHDMGLIGCMLFAVAAQDHLWLMRPSQFIADPARWLACLEPGRARHSATPSFALAYAARKIPAARFGELDLSAWRSVTVGAEPVDAAALHSFTAAAAPAGFSPRAYLPAYGLAENTLAVTAAALGGPLTMVQPDWSAIRFGAAVPVRRSADLGELPVRPGAGWLIGHGMPRQGDGIGVRIVDERRRELPDGALGEIAVSGTSVAQGYHGCPGERSAAFCGGDLFTGDAGFVYGSDLYVLGRMGDSIKLRGRSVYAEDLDAKVAAATGLAKDRLVVVGAAQPSRAAVAVFADARPGPWADAAYRFLRAELGPEPAITVSRTGAACSSAPRAASPAVGTCGGSFKRASSRA